MGKRKYLIFFFFVSFSFNSFASAWLPTQGSTKYSMNTLSVDNSSKSLKNKRILLFKQIEQKISNLIIIKYKLERSNNVSNKRLIKNIDQQINKLKRALEELSGFDFDFLVHFEIEKSLDQNNSLGINLLQKTNKFVDSDYTSAYKVSEEYTNRIFYKHRIAEKNNKVYTLSPELIFKKGRNYEQCDAELKFLYGRNKQRKNKIAFFETAVGIGYANLVGYPKYAYYNFSISKGINFQNGFSIANYVKYDINRNKNSAYQQTIYEQITFSKSLELPNNSKIKNSSISIGYFWYQSLVFKYLKMSGLVFSMEVSL